MPQDQPYGSVSTVGATATFSGSQTGILSNSECIEIAGFDYVVSALATNGLSCTLTPTPITAVTNVGFNYSGGQQSIRG